MPPMALTIEVPNYKEGELLDYVWPVFSWNDWNNGFTNRTNHVTTLNDNEVGFGYEACGLKAGYNRAKDGGMDSGPATWPVFCILDNERKLNGRFGDPQYSFLTFQLYRCGSPGVKLTKSLNETWQRDSKFGGKCATTESGEKQKISNENIGEKIGMNVWFQVRAVSTSIVSCGRSRKIKLFAHLIVSHRFSRRSFRRRTFQKGTGENTLLVIGFAHCFAHCLANPFAPLVAVSLRRRRTQARSALGPGGSTRSLTKTRRPSSRSICATIPLSSMTLYGVCSMTDPSR